MYMSWSTFRGLSLHPSDYPHQITAVTAANTDPDVRPCLTPNTFGPLVCSTNVTKSAATDLRKVTVDVLFNEYPDVFSETVKVMPEE